MPARMRYAAQALDELRKIDAQTSVTLNYIRFLASSGKIPVHMIGRRRLINFDALLDYLSKPESDYQNNVQFGGIRKLPEKLQNERRM